MPKLQTPNGELYFEQRGSRADLPVLLIMGVGCQLIHWPESFLDKLVASDLRVIYHDNRDCGLSFDVDAPPPDIQTLIAARDNPSALSPPYSLSDMAMDAVYLLNHIGQSGAHIVGLSMGGMIAQRLVAEHPSRVFSMTSVMSTTGNPTVGEPTPEAVAALASNFIEADRQTAIQRTREVGDFLSGPTYPSTKFGMARIAEEAYDRAFRPASTLRQFAAIITDGDRRDSLRETQIPILAIHGDSDPLVAHSGSVDLIETVPNGRLELIDNMGHDIPEPLVPDIASMIIEHIQTAEALR